MESLTKLKRRLNRLSKRNDPRLLKKRIITYTERCDDIIHKLRDEHKDLEAALNSKKDELISLNRELEFYRSIMRHRGTCMQCHSAKLLDYQHIHASM